MTREHGNRHAVVELHCAGQRQCEIYRSLNRRVPRSFISKVVRKYQETGSTDDRPKSGRPRSVRTRQLIQNVRLRIRRNPTRSGRKMACDMNVSRSTMQRVLAVDLGLKALHQSQVQMLSAADKANRVTKCKRLRGRFTVDDVKMIFSDEKMFTVEPKLNRQNSRVYATSCADADAASLKVRRAEFPAKIMVWGAICSSGVLQLKFVDPGTKVNKEYYINEVLESVLLPEARRLYPDGDWIFQQGSFSKEHCPQWIGRRGFVEYPPHSPDLTPPPTVAKLTAAIECECTQIPREVFGDLCDSIALRRQQCLDQNGRQFENKR
uniref:Paired domain-containing protein n=1 Tax=Sphaeramia orbicularis TaxID=375764 RepID=A0A673A9W4_9TELE